MPKFRRRPHEVAQPPARRSYDDYMALNRAAAGADLPEPVAEPVTVPDPPPETRGVGLAYITRTEDDALARMDDDLCGLISRVAAVEKEAHRVLEEATAELIEVRKRRRAK